MQLLTSTPPGTVQKQYTAGPLQIVRWSNIINCHIFPGPAIVTALHSAADDAVTAYFTSVETQISGPGGYENHANETEEDGQVDSDGSAAQSLREPEEEEEEQDGDRLSSEDDEGSDDGDDDPTDLQENHTKSPDRFGRKLSVVSVSTTISTKTETLSPQPTSPHSMSMSSFSAALPASASWAAAQTSLGDPPTARGLLLLAEMSSAGNLMNEAYTAECVKLARQDPEFVLGFIAQRSLNKEPGDNFITMTPGVQIGGGGDALGQQYNTPEKVVRDAGTDVVIVGRGIYGAQDRRKVAEEYRSRSWRAYEERVGSRPK